MLQTNIKRSEVLSAKSHQHVDNISQNVVDENQRGCPFHLVEIPNSDLGTPYGQNLLPKSVRPIPTSAQ